MALSNIVPLLNAPRAAAAPAADMTYHGGPVIANVEIVAVYWGSFWQQQATLISQLEGYFNYIVTSSFLDMLAEYSTPTQTIGEGTFNSSVTVTTSEPGGGSGTVSDAQIQTALQQWTQDGTIPAVNANTLYFVFLPQNVTSTLNGSSSCQQYCGYHSSAGSIYYALMPYSDCSGCTQGSELDTLTVISSHELAESITDPSWPSGSGTGWFDDNTGNEIGDVCVGNTTQLGNYTIQQVWSQKQNACASAPA
ncbi:MAG: hypothetical protein JO322_06950 [Candidatus Eremiobacteraeota bacterium]|nr:hypothetical protein [Candidatus Eremiobacteraeota bacterium]